MLINCFRYYIMHKAVHFTKSKLEIKLLLSKYFTIIVS